MKKKRCPIKNREYAKLHRKRNPDMWRSIRLKSEYGITLEDFNNLLRKQNYVCASCKNPEYAIDSKTKQIRRLAVDHCHSTGKIRGLLCTGCNSGLGHFHDSIEKLQLAILYLQNNSF